MLGLLADVNAEAHCNALVSVCRGPGWLDIWNGLNLRLFRFMDFSLSRETPDSIIWELCQREQLVLVTGNRNAEGDDSLETTIQVHGTVSSLPVVTVADMERLLRDRSYCIRAAERLLEYLFEMDRHLGSGRLFIP
jgi:hypothetical protein